MAKLFTVLLTMGMFFFSFAAVGFLASGGAQPKSPEDIQEWVVKEVAKSKKTLPQDCGNGVTWFDIEGKGKAVNYKYQIDASSQQVLGARSRIEKGIKSSMMLKWMIPDGVQAYCTFYDRNGNFVFRMMMDS